MSESSCSSNKTDKRRHFGWDGVQEKPDPCLGRLSKCPEGGCAVGDLLYLKVLAVLTVSTVSHIYDT